MWATEFFQTLIQATYEAGLVLGLSPEEKAVAIVENIRYVLGPAAGKIDLGNVQTRFTDTLRGLEALSKESSPSNTDLGIEMFRQLTRSISLQMRKKLHAQVLPCLVLSCLAMLYHILFCFVY